MHCPHCGSPVSAGEKFCRICGNSLKPKPANQPKPAGILDERYEILEKLESGGMGQLYRVRDRRLDRVFALKEMKVEFPDEEKRKQAEEWFRREARILCNLRHPNIPIVTDFFNEDDKYYLVMDYIDGSPLDKENLPLTEAQARDFLGTALDILQYLHNNDIIHRDIKTEHFMRDKATGKYFLVDFGTARSITPQKKNTAIGTPGFASPEHYEGFADQRSDIYSLGAVMYHIVTGIDPRTRPPFDFKPLAETAPHISRELAETIKKAITYKPEQRFQSAAEMAQSISLSSPAFTAPPVKPAVKVETTPLTEIPRETRIIKEDIVPPKPVKEPGKKDPLKTLLFDEPDYNDYRTLHRKRKMTVQTSGALPPVMGIEGKAFRVIKSPHMGWVSSIAFVPPGDVLAVAYMDGVIILWDITANEQVGVLKKTITYSTHLCMDVAASINGEYLAQAMDNGKIILWDMVTNKKIRAVATNSETVNSIVFSGEKHLVSGSQDESVTLWDVDEFYEVSSKWGNKGGVKSMALSNDRKLLVIGCGDGMLRMWELHSLVSMVLKPDVERGHRGKVNGLSFSWDDKYLLSVGDDRYLRQWNVMETRPVYMKPGKSASIGFKNITAIACSPRQNIFVTGKEDGTVSIWDMDKFKPEKTLEEHPQRIVKIAFSQNGYYFATASEDGLVIAWK